ncbi:dermonecrotic toxin domain-containing protein [Pseudomonas hunanensis]|uniref:dermonecrotic toxin domain-containing protein n=1 Tax=Pseudomonas hunanensis TaxID=1247546 RepID=UPI0030DB96A5
MPATHAHNLKHAVAAQFASRPTLRQVAGEQVMKVILEHYPLVGVHRPEMTSAAPLYLMSMHPDGVWHPQPLVDVVLQALLAAKPLDLAPAGDYRLSLNPPRRFFAIESSLETAEGDLIEPARLTDGLNALLPMLLWHFQQAQIDYWNGDATIDRDLWLQQLLRANLLDGLKDEALDDEQRKLLRDLMMGNRTGLDVQLVRVALREGEDTFHELLPGLLITASSEVRELTLWCSPEGLVRSFDAQASFGAALQIQMAGRYRFDELSWQGLTVEGDAFALYSALLLEILLERVARLRWSAIDSVDQLEHYCHLACDPASFFAEFSDHGTGGLGLALPKGLSRADTDSQTAYLQAMLDLSLLQQHSPAQGIQDGLPDLHTYAATRLREAMLHDHPVDANYFPDDLILSVETFVSDGHGLGFGQKTGEKKLTLTQLAIGRLDATAGGVVTHIAHRENQLIMKWMTIDYVRELVQRVDIGGTYPRHVQSMLDRSASRAEHISAFAIRWRITLMFDAARARAVKRLDKFAYGALAEFCRSGQEGAAAVRIAALAFKRSPTSERVDVAHGFYVIELIELGAHLLYCPLYTDKALIQFDSAQALLDAISRPGALQDNVLLWIEQAQRGVYDNGGFREPHLPQWLPDPYTLPEKPQPVQLALQFWAQDVDRQMFEAKGRMLLELADRSAMSNSEVRWRLVTAFSWELLNVVFPVLPGPLTSVAWLYIGMRSLINDVQGLASSHLDERIQAMVDVLNNTLLALIHLQTPQLATPAVSGDLPPLLLEGPPAGNGVELAKLSTVTREPSVSVDSLQAMANTQLDFSWRGAGGLNGLSSAQRGQMRALATSVSLAGREPQTQGVAAGLVRIGDDFYVSLDGDVYRVSLDNAAFRIIGPDGTVGPYLMRDGNVWHLNNSRLYGGNDRSGELARERLRKKLSGPIAKAQAEIERLLLAAEAATKDFNALSEQIVGLRDPVKKVEDRLQKAPPTDPGERAQFEQATELFKRKLQQLHEQTNALRTRRLALNDRLFQGYLEAERNIIYVLDKASASTQGGSVRDQRILLGQVRKNLISFGMFFIDELLALGGFREYDQLTNALNVAPPEKQAELYARFRTMLEKLLEEQPRIINVSSQLDRLLAITDIDMQVPYVNTTLTVSSIIESRKTTTINIRFFQAMGLVELALQWHKGTPTQHYMIFRHALASQRLRVAAQTHHLLMFCDLPVAERIEVLQSAWDEYLAAILNAERIKTLGSKLIDVQRLEAYKQQMVELKTIAGEALVEAMREQADGQVRGTRRAVYSRKSLQVAHTRAGQIVIGSESVVDGQAVLQVVAAFNKSALHRFQKQGNTWVEEVAAGEPEQPLRTSTPESERNNRELAEAMLAQNENVIAQARALVAKDADDMGLMSMLDGQINEVAELREQLSDANAEHALLAGMDDALIQLRQARRDCLVALYSKTRYPGSRGLNFLHQQGLLAVEYVGPRQVVSDGYLDEYRISLLRAPGESRGKPLWAAHFHFADSQAAPTAFGKGHLKLWSQRKMGYREQMKAASEGQVLSIYRGNLTYAQARDVIPFNL